jgi:hypothetical protein
MQLLQAVGQAQKVLDGVLQHNRTRLTRASAAQEQGKA